MRSALRGARQKASLLENEIAALEQKTLDAIAEAGALRRQLDLLRESRETGGDWGEVAREQETLRRRLREEEEERHLLTRALSDSETEIARLARSLEQLVRSFAAA
jgi:chromosome segregation ATPase